MSYAQYLKEINNNLNYWNVELQEAYFSQSNNEDTNL